VDSPKKKRTLEEEQGTMTKKRTYTRSFKLQALELAKSGQKSISGIERELGITRGLLHKWKTRMKVDGEQAFPGKGRQKEDEELIRRLKREDEVLSQERDILKSAIDFFGQHREIYQFISN
jgi:transposase-like protein